MFFKMLKSDLKQSRALNFILLLFSVIAAAFVFTGAAQVYTNLTQSERTAKVCESSDVIAVYYEMGGVSKTEALTEVRKAFDESSLVKEYHEKEALLLEYYMFDFDNVEAKDINELQYGSIFLTTPFTEKDLIFDTDGNHVGSKNGTITVPLSVANPAGIKPGDKVRIITPIGSVYEFTVSVLTKEPLFDTGSDLRFIISANDYARIAEDFPLSTELFSLTFSDPSNPNSLQELWKYMGDRGLPPGMIPTKIEGMTDSAILSYVLSVFLIIGSIFLILIIFMTIRFTIIAALKNEEKEIGVMRALGVDSLGFRWMFAAKYIFFAIIGGIIGVLVGFPLSNMLMRIFSANYIDPSVAMLALIGTIAALLNTLLIIFFSLRVMKRIGKISVMDAIRSENSGERFGKGSVIRLEKRKRMSVPFFLALSDILSRAKRYLFLVIAYTLGFAIMLMIFNIKNTVISPDFMKFFNIYQMDFSISYIDDDKIDIIQERMASENMMFFEAMNDILSEKGIPAEVDTAKCTFAEIQNGSNKTQVQLFYGALHPERLNFRKGSRVPEKDNEVVLSYYTAHQKGYNIGDTIKVSFQKMNENRTETENFEKELVITGFIDVLEGGTFEGYLGGGNNDDILSYGEFLLAMRFTEDSTDDSATLAKIKELFGEKYVTTGQKFIEDSLKEYSSLFSLLEIVMGAAVILISVLITYLYQNIFIAEETAEIALMKSMGYTDGSVKYWQTARMLILALFSVVLSEVLFKTLGGYLVEKLFGILELSGFGFVFEVPYTLVILPAVFIGVIIATALLNVRKVNNVAVWNISNE